MPDYPKIPVAMDMSYEGEAQGSAFMMGDVEVRDACCVVFGGTFRWQGEVYCVRIQGQKENPADKCWCNDQPARNGDSVFLKGWPLLPVKPAIFHLIVERVLHGLSKIAIDPVLYAMGEYVSACNKLQLYAKKLSVAADALAEARHQHQQQEDIVAQLKQKLDAAEAQSPCR